MVDPLKPPRGGSSGRVVFRTKTLHARGLDSVSDFLSRGEVPEDEGSFKGTLIQRILVRMKDLSIGNGRSCSHTEPLAEVRDASARHRDEAAGRGSRERTGARVHERERGCARAFIHLSASLSACPSICLSIQVASLSAARAYNDTTDHRIVGHEYGTLRNHSRDHL